MGHQCGAAVQGYGEYRRVYCVCCAGGDVGYLYSGTAAAVVEEFESFEEEEGGACACFFDG